MITLNISIFQRRRKVLVVWRHLKVCVYSLTRSINEQVYLLTQHTFQLHTALLSSQWQTEFILICTIFLLRIYGFTERKVTDMENTISGIFVLKYWSCIGSQSSKVIIEFVGIKQGSGQVNTVGQQRLI